MADHDLDRGTAAGTGEDNVLADGPGQPDQAAQDESERSELGPAGPPRLFGRQPAETRAGLAGLGPYPPPQAELPDAFAPGVPQGLGAGGSAAGSAGAAGGDPGDPYGAPDDYDTADAYGPVDDYDTAGDYSGPGWPGAATPYAPDGYGIPSESAVADADYGAGDEYGPPVRLCRAWKRVCRAWGRRRRARKRLASLADPELRWATRPVRVPGCWPGGTRIGHARIGGLVRAGPWRRDLPGPGATRGAWLTRPAASAPPPPGTSPLPPGTSPPPPGTSPRTVTADSLTADLLLPGRHKAPSGGWRRAIFEVTGGLVRAPESAAERRRSELAARARTPVCGGHHRVAVLSLKGGVGKTTTTVGLGATLASLRGDRVIAVDANPDRGTLSDKLRLETSATVRDLLNERHQIHRYADVRAYTTPGREPAGGAGLRSRPDCVGGVQRAGLRRCDPGAGALLLDLRDRLRDGAAALGHGRGAPAG